MAGTNPDHPERMQLFAKTAAVDEALPYGPLLKCLEKDNVYITRKASRIITALLWCASAFETFAGETHGRTGS